MELKGKHAFITGAGKRVGRAIAEALIDRGVKVSAHYRTSKTEAEDLKTRAKGKAEVFPVQADLLDVKSLQAGVKTAMAGLGEIDILINSASDFYPTPAETCSEEQWDALLDTNLKGQFFLAQACYPSLKKRRGVILNVVDVYAEMPLRKFTPYVASKAGLLMMTRNLAKEWAPEIRVNGISPGAVLPPPTYTEEQIKAAAEKALLKRWGEPADIAAGAIFLLGNDYITGFNLKVDGGKSLGG